MVFCSNRNGVSSDFVCSITVCCNSICADHTVVAATGNTVLFSREEIAQKLRETEHPAEEG